MRGLRTRFKNFGVNVYSQRDGDHMNRYRIVLLMMLFSFGYSYEALCMFRMAKGTTRKAKPSHKVQRIECSHFTTNNTKKSRNLSNLHSYKAESTAEEKLDKEISLPSNYCFLANVDALRIAKINAELKEKSPKDLDILSEACGKNDVKAIEQYISNTPNLSARDVGEVLASNRELNNACQKAMSKKFPLALGEYFRQGKIYRLDEARKYINNGFIILWQKREPHPFSRIPMLHYLTQYRKVLSDNGKEKVLGEPDYQSMELLLQAGVNPYYKNEDLLLENVVEDNFLDAFAYANDVGNEEHRAKILELLNKYPRDPRNTEDILVPVLNDSLSKMDHRNL
jgi:hypothetical protein